MLYLMTHSTTHITLKVEFSLSHYRIPTLNLSIFFFFFCNKVFWIIRNGWFFLSSLSFQLWSGGIFSKDSDDALNAFKEAAQYFNRHVSETVNLQAVAITVDTTDSYIVQKAGIFTGSATFPHRRTPEKHPFVRCPSVGKSRWAHSFTKPLEKQHWMNLLIKFDFTVCDMISSNNDGDGNNVVAIFGPNSPETTGSSSSLFIPINGLIYYQLVWILDLVASICKKLQLPHFTALWQPIDVNTLQNDSFTRNLFPHPKLYSSGLYKIIQSFHWKKFAVIYDSDDALVRFQEVFQISADRNARSTQMLLVRFHRLPDTLDGYVILLKSLKKSGISSMIVDCSMKNTERLLNLTHRVLMNDEYHVCIWLLNNDALLNL